MLSKLRIAVVSQFSVLAMIVLSYGTIGCHHDDDDGGSHAGYYDRGYNRDYDHARYDDRADYDRHQYDRDFR